MKTIKIFLVLSVFLIALPLDAQDEVQAPVPDKLSFGLGGGLDYGGFGANMLLYPNNNLGLFVGGGYALAGLGINGGAKIRFVSARPDSKVNAYLLMMYGYNAAIAVAGATNYNKLFYGPSAGFGFDTRQRQGRIGYWSVAILIPFRSSEVNDYMDDLEENHGVDFNNKLFPIAFSIGYRFILQ